MKNKKLADREARWVSRAKGCPGLWRRWPAGFLRTWLLPPSPRRAVCSRPGPFGVAAPTGSGLQDSRSESPTPGPATQSPGMGPPWPPWPSPSPQHGAALMRKRAGSDGRPRPCLPSPKGRASLLPLLFPLLSPEGVFPVAFQREDGRGRRRCERHIHRLPPHAARGPGVQPAAQLRARGRSGTRDPAARRPTLAAAPDQPAPP